MKKILLCLLVLMMLCGCSGKKETAGDDSSTGSKYLNVFKENADKSLEDIADKLIKVDDEMGLVAMPVEPGYLNGFSSEITAFNFGEVVSPMIGSIPFIIYVFETDDVDGLKKEIESNKDMRWNICTEATDYVLDDAKGRVFFMMYSNEE